MRLSSQDQPTRHGVRVTSCGRVDTNSLAYAFEGATSTFLRSYNVDLASIDVQLVRTNNGIEGRLWVALRGRRSLCFIKHGISTHITGNLYDVYRVIDQ